MRAIERIRTRLAKEGLSGRIPELEEELKALGDNMVDEAFASKKRGNITYNQHDAFGWGLFFNGTLLEKGFGHLEQKAEVPRMGWEFVVFGREDATYDIEHFVPTSSKGYALLVLNSVWYSARQEDEGQVVLSQVVYQMDELEQKYNGHIELINITRRR